MSCAQKCLQFLLALFNLAVLAIGALILIATTLFFVSFQHSQLSTISIIIIAIGGFIVVLGVFGIFGSCCKSHCALMFYLILLVILAIAQVASGSYAIATSENQSRVSEISLDSWNSFNQTVKDDFQKKYDCCGYGQGASDFIQCPIGKDSCKPQVEGLVKSTLFSSGIYLFVGVGVELLTGIIAGIILFDERRKY